MSTRSWVFPYLPTEARTVSARATSQDLKEGRNLYEMICVIAEMNQEENACFRHSQVSLHLHSLWKGDLKHQGYRGGKSS